MPKLKAVHQALSWICIEQVQGCHTEKCGELSQHVEKERFVQQRDFLAVLFIIWRFLIHNWRGFPFRGQTKASAATSRRNQRRDGKWR